MHGGAASITSARDLESNEAIVKRSKKSLLFFPLEWWRPSWQSGIVKAQQERQIHWTRVRTGRFKNFDDWVFRPSGIKAGRSWSWTSRGSPRGSFGLFLADVFGIARFEGFKNYPKLSAKALHCCFVCLEGAEGNVAIRVPCARPTKIRTVRKQDTNLETGEEHLTYNKSSRGEGGVECEVAILSRMREVLYRYLGAWKARLPYYGVLDAYEIEVSCFDHPNLDV